MSEQVLVFPEEMFNNIGKFNGFEPDAERFLNSEAWQKSLHFVDRAFAESTERLKQVISYDVIVQGDKVFLYRRSKKGGEGRLWGNYSIGVGGHTNPVDFVDCPLTAFYTGRARELWEEVGLQENFESELLGCIYDNSNSVGRVHWGLCHKVIISEDFDFKATDAALAEGQFVKPEELSTYYNEMETWSQILSKHIIF